MLIGGLLLFAVSQFAGETAQLHLAMISARVLIALVYLITAGSILGFTAYLWLLRHDSPTRVGTYAYVNPVVAMILGAFFGAERFGLRSLSGVVKRDCQRRVERATSHVCFAARSEYCARCRGGGGRGVTVRRGPSVG